MFAPFFRVFTEVVRVKERSRTVFVNGSLTNTTACNVNLFAFLLFVTEGNLYFIFLLGIALEPYLNVHLVF